MHDGDDMSLPLFFAPNFPLFMMSHRSGTLLHGGVDMGRGRMLLFRHETITLTMYDDGNRGDVKGTKITAYGTATGNQARQHTTTPSYTTYYITCHIKFRTK